MKKYEFKVSTGITSIMMIFVVLCLTAFGVLSYTSANADIKLSMKNADSKLEYYQAEGRLNEKICHIDGIIVSIRQKAPEGEGYYEEIKKNIREAYGDNVYNQANNTVTLKESIDDSRYLCAVIKINDENAAKRYEVESCMVETE